MAVTHHLQSMGGALAIPTNMRHLQYGYHQYSTAPLTLAPPGFLATYQPSNQPPTLQAPQLAYPLRHAASLQATMQLPQHCTMSLSYPAGPQGPRMLVPQHYAASIRTMVPTQPQQMGSQALMVAAPQQVLSHHHHHLMAASLQHQLHQTPAPLSQHRPIDTSPALKYLQATYRVGMLAMETLTRRVHDDRPPIKYSRTPPCGDDVKWLLGVSLKLGHYYVQQYIAGVLSAVVSPFILQDVAFETARQLTRNNNHHQWMQQLRTPMLHNLLQKAIQMYQQCLHQRMHHIQPDNYDELVQIICSAQKAHSMVPGGMMQFTELLQTLRRNKSCKKDLWLRIVHAVAPQNPINW